MDAARQAVALSLYQTEEGRPAPKLQDLVPKYLPRGLPTDPYSGQEYRYRISDNAGNAQIATGGIVKSDETAPDTTIGNLDTTLVGVGASTLPVGAPLWNASTTAQAQTDPQTAAIEQVVMERQVREIAARFPQRHRFDPRRRARQRIVIASERLQRRYRLVTQETVGIVEHRDQRIDRLL